MAGVLRAALKDTSTLIRRIESGLQVIQSGHAGLISAAIRADFTDSIDLDEALRVGNDQSPRWDYLMGHGPKAAVIGLEPHSAHTSEVSVVINKRKAARDQLRSHLRDGRGVAAWFWVASGKVALVPYEKQFNRLAQEGIQFVGGQLAAKHLANLSGPTPAMRRGKSKRRPR
jgi:hypothetical protein